MNNFSTVKVTTDDHVGIIKLSRPEIRNAYSMKMSAELSEALEHLDVDDNIRVIVITGEGDHFSVGIDLNEVKEFKKLSNAQKEKYSAKNIGKRIYPFELRKPVICAVNGSAAGFGAAYAMSCDIRLVSQSSLMSFSFVRVGVVPELGSTWSLPRIIGMEKALDLLLTGKKLVGQEIVDNGLALKVVDDNRLVDEAITMAKSIAALSAPVCVAHTKKITWQRLMEKTDFKEAIIQDRKHVDWAISLPDSLEGSLSFLEKRKPQWKDSIAAEVPKGRIEVKNEQ